MKRVSSDTASNLAKDLEILEVIPAVALGVELPALAAWRVEDDIPCYVTCRTSGGAVLEWPGTDMPPHTTT